MFLINETALAGACLAAGAMQLAHTAGFVLSLRSQAGRSGAAGPPFPSVCVILAAKGVMGPFESNIRSLLGQDYPGQVDYLFVTPTRADPAYAAIERLLAAQAGLRSRLVFSDETPVRCCGKIVDLLYALRVAPPASDILVFVDCDVRVATDWLRHLVAPLQDPRAVAAVTHAVYVPFKADALQLLRLACSAFIASSMYLGRVVAGWSWAIRRQDFERLRIPEVWSRRLIDDTCLDEVFARDGRSVRWAALAAPAFFDDCDLVNLQRNCNKAFLYLRTYDPPVWSLMALAVLGTTCLVAGCLVGHAKWRLLGLVLGINMANIYIIFAALRRYVPGQMRGAHPAFRNYPVLAALCAPAVLLVFLVALGNSLVSRTVRWGGRVYRIHAPDRIEIVA